MSSTPASKVSRMAYSCEACRLRARVPSGSLAFLVAMGDVYPDSDQVCSRFPAGDLSLGRGHHRGRLGSLLQGAVVALEADHAVHRQALAPARLLEHRPRPQLLRPAQAE